MCQCGHGERPGPGGWCHGLPASPAFVGNALGAFGGRKPRARVCCLNPRAPLCSEQAAPRWEARGCCGWRESRRWVRGWRGAPVSGAAAPCRRLPARAASAACSPPALLFPPPCRRFLTAPAASFSSPGSRCHDPPGRQEFVPLRLPPAALPPEPPRAALAGTKAERQRAPDPRRLLARVCFSLSRRRQSVTSCCSLTEVADRPEAVLGRAAFASQSEPWGERDGLRAGLMQCRALLCWASLPQGEDTRGGAELWSKGTKPSATPQHGLGPAQQRCPEHRVGLSSVSASGKRQGLEISGIVQEL